MLTLSFFDFRLKYSIGILPIKYFHKINISQLNNYWAKNLDFTDIKVPKKVPKLLTNILPCIWVKVFKNGPSKSCGRQLLKNLKWYGLLRQTISLQNFYRPSSRNFTWFILVYLDPYASTVYCKGSPFIYHYFCCTKVIAPLKLALPSSHSFIGSELIGKKELEVLKILNTSKFWISIFPFRTFVTIWCSLNFSV